MTTVPADGYSLDPRWLKFVYDLVLLGRPTWTCTGWGPWARYILTIIVIVTVVVAVPAGIGVFLAGLVP